MLHPGTRSNAAQPTPERCVHAQRWQRLPGAHECLLAQVVSETGIVAQPPQQLTQLLLTTASEDALRDTNNLFPSTIQGVVQRRVDQLTAAQQFVLRIAAVIGRVFEPQLLIDIMPLKQGIDARRQLAELCALGYFERATER